MSRAKAERNSYGRFFYRFPNGESGADVYDRLTVFEDHLVRDMDAGRFADNTQIVIVTHGLSLRVFLSRWFHWTVGEYETVYNPPSCVPLMLERTDEQAPAGAAEGGGGASAAGACRMHTCTKKLYALTAASLALLRADDPALGVMMTPEHAWTRTLRVIAGAPTPASPGGA
jgi:hypothetical protein